MILCSGEPFRLDDAEKLGASNFEVVSAFSLAPHLVVHCIINTAGNELFVAASSCRNAKIIAVYKGHIEAIACGRCSRREADELLRCAPDHFRNDLESSPDGGEPHSLWSSGHVSEAGQRVAKERMEKALMRGFD